MEDYFDKIYEKNKDDIFRLALSYTNNYADAEDITINTFTKLYKNISKITDETHLRRWLLKVTINECKSLSVSYWKKKILFFKDNEENNIKVENNENNLLDCISKLPKTDRIIIHLYYYENYSIEEIANILNKSISSIKTRLHRARLNLKDILKEDLDYDK